MPLEVTFPDGSVRQFADGTPPETIRSSWQAPAAPDPEPVPAPEAWPTGMAGVGRGTVELLKGIVPGAAGAVTSLGETTGAIADLIRRHAGMEPGPLRQWSRDAQQWVENQFPAHPEANLTRAVGQGLGQIGEVLGETVLTGGAGLLPKAESLGARLLAGKQAAKAAGHYAAARMAPAEFADAYTRSLEQGDDPDLAVAKSLGYATVAAMLEDRLGAGKLARKLVSPGLVEKVGATPVGRFLRDSLNNVVSNAAEESAQRLAQDLIVTGKPDLKGIASEGLVGGIVGSIAGAPGAVRIARAVASPEQRAYVAEQIAKETDPARKAALEEYLGNLAELPTPKARKLTFEEIAAKEGFAPEQIDFIPEAKPVPVHRGPALELFQTDPVGPEVAGIQPVSAAYKLGEAVVNVTPDSVTVRGAKPEQIPDLAGALVQQNLVKPKVDAGDQTEALTKAIAEVQAKPRFQVDAEVQGGKLKVYLPAIKDRTQLRSVLREERAHTRIATPEGQTALAEFMRTSPLSEAQFQDLIDKGYARRPEETPVEGEHPDISASKDQLYKTRLTDEFIAKLNRDPKWKQWTETAVAWVKKSFGLSLKPEQAGRLVLRSLRGVGAGGKRESISPKAPYTVGPVWHGGTFDIETGDSVFSKWTHFGTRAAAEERVGGSGVVDNLIRSISVEEVDGKWLYSVDGVDYDKEYDTKAEARKAAEQEAIDMAEYTEPDGAFTQVYLRGPFVKLPDLGTWGLWDIVRNLPEKAKLSSQERETLGEISRTGKRGDDFDYLAGLLKDKGFNGIEYKNLVEDKGSTSYIILDPADAKSAEDVTVDDSGNPVPAERRFNPKSQDIRESLSPVELVAKAQSEFPTAPQFRIGTETKFQGDHISLDPDLAKRPEWEQQNEIRAVVMEAGVNLLPPKALSEDLYYRLQVGDARRVEAEARRLGVDVATPEGRQAVAASVLLQHVHDARIGGRIGGWLPSVVKPDFGLLDSGTASAVARLATTLGLSLFGNKGARGLLAARGILQGILDSAKQTESMPNAAVDQAQVMADLARHDIQTYGPWLARLRSMAGELEAHSYERRLFRTLDGELQLLASDGKTRQTGDESKKFRETPDGPEPIILNPASPTFPQDMYDVGRELTAAEINKHERYLAELQARAAVKLLDGIDGLASTIAYLEQTDSRVDLTQAREERSQLLEKLDKLGPAAHARAIEIRASDALLPHADAARRVLNDPHILNVTETIDPHAGRTLRPEAALSPQEQSALEVAAAATANQAWVFRDRVAKAAQEFTDKTYLPGMRKLREKLLARLQKAGEMDVAMAEVMAAAAGEADQAGTLTGREAATALRDQDTAIRHFAEALARARPDTRVWELRQALLSGLDPETDLWTTRYQGLVLDAAREAGISQDAVGRLLQLLRRSPEFQNAILDLHNTASAAVTRATITAIEAIEQALADQAQAEAQAEVGADTEARQEGRDRAKAARALVRDTAAAHLRQLNASRKAATKDVRTLRTQIAELEVQREQHDLLQDIADSAVRELPNIRRMVYEFQDGVKLDAFGTQPAVTIRPGQAYDSALLNQIVQWQQNARDQLDAVDPQTRRGLLVALGDDTTPSLVGAFVDTHFASDLIENTLAPSYPVDWLSRKGFIRTKELLPRLVHGFWGRRISETERNWVDVSRKVELLSSREGAARHALMLKAFKSLGLNPRTIEGQVKFRAVYNEFANELRQFGSGVEAGQKIWSSGLEGAVVTNELLTLLRNDRRVGRLGQEIEANRAYGGARENFPGRQVVRPQGETGDVGLGRLGDKAIIKMLSEKYELAPRANGAITDRTAIDAFWADADARDALRSHIRSALRTDMATSRTPEMQAAEGRLARAIDSGRISLRALRTVDDWADAIQSFLPEGSTIRASEQLRAELDQYGALAMSRNRTPDGGPVESTFSGRGEGDRTGFTSSATKMAFPPSWYNYGAVDGLRGLLSEIADPAQVEYLETLKQAGKELTATAEKIKSALQSGDEDKARLLNELAPLIRWHTTGLFSGTKITAERAEAAASKMKTRASILADEYNRVLNPRVETVGKFNRLLSNILPFLLLRPTAWASNVFGGPIALQPIFSRLVGQTKGSALSVASMGVSAGGMIYNIARDIGESFGVFPHSPYQSFLDSEGVGANFDRQASGEQEAFSTGTLPRNRVQRGVDVAKAGADKLSEYVGVRRGDRDLNLFVARAVVPLYIRKLRGILTAWQASGEPTLGVSATKQAAGIREWLGKFGNPEEVLTQIGGIDPRRFYESKLGRRIGYALIEEANASTKTNRPSSNSLLALMGWTIHMLDMLAAAFRVQANAPRTEKLRKAATAAAAGAIAMSTAYYVQIIGRRGVNETIAKLSSELGEILAGVPRDIDDPDLLDKLLNWLTEVNGLIRAHVWGAGAVEDMVRAPIEALGRASTPAATLTPLHPEFWDRPWQDVAGDLALSVPAGIGVNNVQLPALGILQQTLTTGLQAGRGIQTVATNPGSPAARAGGMEDIATAGRNALNLLGLVGATLAEVVVPGGNAGRASRSQIVDAANRAGIQVEAPFSSGKWLNPTPVRKGLLAAGRELLAAEAAGADTTAAQARIDNLTQFLAERAEKNALDRGEDAATAKQAGVDAVKRILPDLNPYRHAIGRPLTDKELADLKARVGSNPEVTKDEQAAQAVVRAASRKYRFPVSRGMKSPVKRKVRARVLTLR